MQLLDIGFGNFVSQDKIVSVLSPESAPIRRMIQDGREKGLLIDASYGRSTRSVLIMNSMHLILSARTPEELEEAARQKTQEEALPG